MTKYAIYYFPFPSCDCTWYNDEKCIRQEAIPIADVLGLGLDLCEIKRIERSIEQEHFFKRIFTQGEQARINDRGAQTAAGYFAAKEAVAKALGTGFDGFFMDSVEVVPDALGKPECVLYGKAHTRMMEMGATHIMISITHDAGVAAAVAIVMG